MLIQVVEKRSFFNGLLMTLVRIFVSRYSDKVSFEKKPVYLGNAESFWERFGKPKKRLALITQAADLFANLVGRGRFERPTN